MLGLMGHGLGAHVAEEALLEPAIHHLCGSSSCHRSSILVEGRLAVFSSSSRQSRRCHHNSRLVLGCMMWHRTRRALVIHAEEVAPLCPGLHSLAPWEHSTVQV